MSHANDTKLLVIEHEGFSVHLKGRPFNSRFENLKSYKKKVNVQEQAMTLKVQALEGTAVQVFHPVLERMVDLSDGPFPPIFFENEVYQLVVVSKTGKELSFYHEHPLVRRSISKEKVGDITFLMGQLQFMNEVGLTQFSILDGKDQLADITIELFPTKLDYKEDYKRLLEEVSEEVYNLAFHFMKKTFLGASKISSKSPSQAEFHRLLHHYFDRFVNAIQLIERQPHHQLITEYHKVRGDQLRRTDSQSRKYLRKRPYLFKETSHGVTINEKQMMPERGLNAKKTLSFDTLENRFVKFMVIRLQEKIKSLSYQVERYLNNSPSADRSILNTLTFMQGKLYAIEKSPFWRQISRLDRSVLTLVMQM
ncbi:DUF2357 domain-containing protein, partial [Halobacillus trueperi]